MTVIDAYGFPVGPKFYPYSDLSERGSKLVYVCRSGGYVMVRRPRAMPFVMDEKSWRRLPEWEEK